MRLQHYDLEYDKTSAKRLAYEVSKIFGDGKDNDDDPLAGIDAETAVW